MSEQRMDAAAIRFWGLDTGKDPAKIEEYILRCVDATWRDASITDPATDARYYPTRDAIAGDFAMHFPELPAAVAARQINEVARQHRDERRIEKRRTKESQPRIDFEK